MSFLGYFSRGELYLVCSFLESTSTLLNLALSSKRVYNAIFVNRDADMVWRNLAQAYRGGRAFVVLEKLELDAEVELVWKEKLRMLLSARVYASGDNAFGQSGLGRTTSQRLSDLTLSEAVLPFQGRIQQITCGSSHSGIVLRGDQPGGLKTMGWNMNRQCGHTSDAMRAAVLCPAVLKNQNVVFCDMLAQTTLVTLDDGYVTLFGSRVPTNARTYVSSEGPEDPYVKAVLSVDGIIFLKSSNNVIKYNQMENSMTESPVEFQGHVVDLLPQALFVTDTGEVYSWDSPECKLLGIVDQQGYGGGGPPLCLSLRSVELQEGRVAIFAQGHSDLREFFIDQYGHLYARGSNSFHECGGIGLGEFPAPTRVPLPSNHVCLDVAMGSYHSLFLLADTSRHRSDKEEDEIVDMEVDLFV